MFYETTFAINSYWFFICIFLFIHFVFTFVLFTYYVYIFIKLLKDREWIKIYFEKNGLTRNRKRWQVSVNLKSLDVWSIHSPKTSCRLLALCELVILPLSYSYFFIVECAKSSIFESGTSSEKIRVDKEDDRYFSRPNRTDQDKNGKPAPAGFGISRIWL